MSSHIARRTCDLGTKEAAQGSSRCVLSGAAKQGSISFYDKTCILTEMHHFVGERTSVSLAQEHLHFMCTYSMPGGTITAMVGGYAWGGGIFSNGGGCACRCLCGRARWCRSTPSCCSAARSRCCTRPAASRCARPAAAPFCPTTTPTSPLSDLLWLLSPSNRRHQATRRCLGDAEQAHRARDRYAVCLADCGLAKSTLLNNKLICF